MFLTNNDASPKKPMPVIKPCRTRLAAWASTPGKLPISNTTSAAPNATKERVRMPADLWCIQRFSPRMMPASKAKSSQVKSEQDFGMGVQVIRQHGQALWNISVFSDPTG